MNARRSKTLPSFTYMVILLAGWIPCLYGSAADANTLYFAQMADGSGYVTQMVLTNPGASSVTVTLEPFRSNGSPLTLTINGASANRFTWEVKSMGSLFLKTPGTGSQVTGWIRVTSTGPLGGSLVYGYLAGGKTLSEAGLDPSVAVNSFLFTVDTRQGNYSGLAVVNPNGTALDVRYALYDSQGNRKAKTTRRLNGMNHEAKMIGEIFPDQNLSDFTGSVTAFSSGGPIVATTLRFNAEVSTLASIPVVSGMAIVDESGRTAGSLYATDSIVGNLRYAPAGTYNQGAPSAEVGRETHEGPVFAHTFAKGLAVMETEVSRQMWVALRAVQSTLPADPSTSPSVSTLPVDGATWYEAVLFANLLSQQQGLQRVYYTNSGFTTPVTSSNYQTNAVYANWAANGYRLPTEGEWEYFTRAGTTGPFSLPEPAYTSSTYQSCAAGVLTALESVAWFCANGNTQTHPVGTKAANPWGLKDVHGNVMEWCWDWYNWEYPGGPQIDYRGASESAWGSRILRGGAWQVQPKFLRSAFRSYATPGTRGYDLGFRLVRSVND